VNPGDRRGIAFRSNGTSPTQRLSSTAVNPAARRLTAPGELTLARGGLRDKLLQVRRHRTMSVIFATGGLDDVAMALGEAIVGGILLGAVVLIAFSLWKRSLVAGVIACILLLADGAFFQPWTVIAPPPPPDAYDAYWLFRLRVISVIWALLVVVAGACLVRVIRLRKRKTHAHIAASR
jgi:hypothetical protein